MNNLYDQCLRTGFHDINSQFKEKNKIFIFLKNILEKYTNSEVIEGCYLSKNLEFKVYFTFTGFGPFIYLPYKNMMHDLVPFVLKQDIYKEHDWLNERYEKYTDTEYLDIKENVAFLPNSNNLKSIDFEKLSNFIFNHNGYIKIHPLTNKKFLEFLSYKFDNRIIDMKYTGISVLLGAKNIGITSTTELGLLANLYGKKTFDLDKDDYYLNGSTGCYVNFYTVLKQNMNLQKYLNTFLSGLIPWSYCDDEKIIYRYLNFLKEFYEKSTI